VVVEIEIQVETLVVVAEVPAVFELVLQTLY
jgi:hypothetical protein